MGNGEEALADLAPDEQEIFSKAIGNLRQDINSGKYTPEQMATIAQGYDDGSLIASAADFARQEARKAREAKQQAQAKETRLKAPLGKPGDYMKLGIQQAMNSRKGKGK